MEWYFFLIIGVFIFILCVVIYLILLSKKKNQVKECLLSYDIVKNLGEKQNIKNFKVDGNRITIHIIDLSKVNKKFFLEHKIFYTSTKNELKFIIKPSYQNIYQILSQEKI